MFDEKTILARLQNGEDAQDIANEMAAMINAANKAYNDQKAAEEAKAKKLEVQKKKELQEILDLFVDWFQTYYDIDAKDEFDADSILELIESIQESIKSMVDLGTLFHTKKSAAPVGTKIIKSNTKPKSADEALNDFLKRMGW